MRYKYTTIFYILLFFTVISLVVYIIIENNDFKSIIGNIFCGFFTGLIISIVSNIKNRSIYVIEKRIKKLQQIRDNIYKSLELLSEFEKKEKITIFEYTEYIEDIVDSFDIINNLNIEELKKYIIINKIDMNMGEKVLDPILMEVYNGEYIINCRNIKKYETKIMKSLTTLTRLSNVIKKEIEKLTDELEWLNKSVI